MNEDEEISDSENLEIDDMRKPEVVIQYNLLEKGVIGIINYALIISQI